MPPVDDLRRYCLVRALSEDAPSTSDGRPVPRHFSASIDVPDHPFVVVISIVMADDGVATCNSLGTSRRDRATGEYVWVHEALANLPRMGLREWVRYAVAIAAEQTSRADSPLAWPAPPDESDSPESLAVWSRVADTHAAQATQRRKATTPARLRQVATLYNAALAEGRHDPAVAVAEALHLSPSAAKKLLMQCRRTTPPLLPPYERKRKDQGT